MLKIRKFDFPALIISAFSSLAWSVFLFISDLQSRAPGLRRLALLIMVLVSLLALTYLLVHRLRPIFENFASRQKTTLVVFSLVFAALLVVMIPVPLDKFFYALSPTHRLTISAGSSQIDRLQILQFNTASGAIDPAEIARTPQGDLSWQGKVGGQAVLALKPPDQPLLVQVGWDGSSQSFELTPGVKHDAVFVNKTFPIAWLDRVIWLISVWFALASLAFIAMLLLVIVPWKPVKSKGSWLWFALPMFSMWMIYALTYWPGLISPDSIMQWSEVQSGHYSDAHPAIHTMFIWLLSRGWNSPASLMVFHVILLSLVTAWGLGQLQKLQVSPAILWIGSIMFALFPVNGLLVISVWKDITYAIAIFAFFLQFVKIAFSNGKWLANNRNLAGLILVGLFAALSRHNGLPVVLGSLLVLAFVFRPALRRLVSSMVIFLLLWAGIQGPLYSILHVRLYPGFGNILFLDHINAHLHARTPLKPDEQSFIASLLPLTAWPYNCADSDIRKMDGPIPFDYFSRSTAEPARIALNLFMRDPRVDIVHTLCASSLIWKVNTGQYMYFVPLAQDKAGIYRWVTANSLGLVEHSLIPGLVPVLAEQFSDKDLVARPAFYLLVSLFILAVLVLRLPRRKIPLIATPLFLQTGVMLLVNFAQDFRYLYSTVLIALFLLLMLFIPRELEQ